MAAKQKVLVVRQDIPDEALNLLKERYDVDVYPNRFPIPREELCKRIKGVNGVFCMITDQMDKEILDLAGPPLKVVATMSVGYDHLDVTEMLKRGIKIGYTPGVLTDATAEMTIAILLATSRRILDTNKKLINGGWNECAWSPLWMLGWGLSGSTVGIFGMGRIGVGVVKRLQGFSTKNIIYNSRERKPEAENLGASYASFDELLTRSDYVICTAALNQSTKEIFNKSSFNKMKNSAIFVNTSRGGLVNQEDLIDALEKGKIRAAGLDVMTPEPLPVDHPLISAPNLTLVPHMGSAEHSTRVEMALMTARNIIGALEDLPMPNELLK